MKILDSNLPSFSKLHPCSVKRLIGFAGKEAGAETVVFSLGTLELRGSLWMLLTFCWLGGLVFTWLDRGLILLLPPMLETGPC
jgi:hypothetical protein